MLKWAAIFILNRLIFLAAMSLVLLAYMRNNYLQDASLAQFIQALSSLEEIAKALR
ncbi:MAG: hypothetical protein ACLQIQ_18940 [Beijerinckiaceae bacterium]